MHHTVKKSALSRFKPMVENGASVNEVLDALAADDKKFTVDEINELKDALFAGDRTSTGTKPETPASETESKTQPAKKEQKKTGYEEWRMERSGGQLVKLKRVRENVKITETEAETLNAGAKSPGAVNPIMYFLPE